MEEIYEILTFSLGTLCLLTTWFVLRGKATSLKNFYNVPIARVEKIYVYPFKSCHRIEVQSADCLKRGLKYDRTFVVCNKDGQLVSQRVYPKMATIQPKFVYDDGGSVSFALTAPGMDEIIVHVPQDNMPSTHNIKVWNMVGSAVAIDTTVGAWFSKFLGVEGLSVFYMSPRHRGRVLQTDSNYGADARPENESSFSDYSPIMIASEGSMELLNSKLTDKLVIERFRPNIVISGCLAHAEDNWSEVSIGGSVLLNRVKFCSRCKMTTVHPEKGEFSTGEPLQTLKRYRIHSMIYDDEKKSKIYGESPLFGSNFGVLTTGSIHINDILRIKP